jgi:hypothetical protein
MREAIAPLVRSEVHSRPTVGNVGVTSPAPPDAWREVLASDPEALVTQSPEWTEALCAAGRHVDASRLYELPGGRRVVLPMVRRRGLPGAFAVEASLPAAWGIGGVVAQGGARPGDIAAVFSELASRRAIRTSITPSPLQAQDWAAARPPGTVAIPRLAHILALDGGFERVWKQRFTGTARTAVRKAQRAGLTVERDDSGELVPVFYRLFEQSLERWARQQHEPLPLARWRGRRRDPIQKFELIASSLGTALRIWVAWHDGQPAAAILVLQGDNAHYTRGAMDKDLAGPSRANYLLHSLAIEEACAAGCRSYHMGESGQSASLAQFKTRFGARPYPYAEYHLERLQLTHADRRIRGAAKRIIGFKD